MVGPSRQATATTPENFADQLEMYDALATRDPERLTEATLRSSLERTVQRLLEEQDVTRVADLTYDKTQDSIRSSTSGVVGVRPIDWQNRPTFQQVVVFTSHRPRV